jgi:hypothetical protein
MTDDPRTPGTALSVAPSRPPRRGAGIGFWRLWLLLSLVVTALCVWAVFTGLSHLDGVPMHVIVDGEEVGSGGIDLAGLGAAHGLAIAAAVISVVMVVLLLVPMVIVIVLGAVLLAVLCGVGLPMLLLAMLFLLLSSPLWLSVGLVWLVVRNRRRAASATIAA